MVSFQRDTRPTARPLNRRDLQSWFAGLRVISMEDEQIGGSPEQNRFSSWPEPCLVCLKNLRPASFEHRPAVLIYVRAGDFLSPPDHRPIIALCPSAA